MREVIALEQLEGASVAAVGGKCWGLGRLLAADLPVPPGFCIASSAHRRLRGVHLLDDAALAEEIGAAYRRLGGGVVAVRSSAVVEDSAAASYAGQYGTILAVRGEEALFAAIAQCWQSAQTERAAAYRSRQSTGDDELALAVIVQRLVNSEISGVLFTRDPSDASGATMLVEASWGLGESIVSGAVTPDRYRLDYETGRLLEQHVERKGTMLTMEGPCEVELARQAVPCLTENRLTELAELGRRIEAVFGDARDVEWAWAEGQFWLLQARPITAPGAAERAAVRRDEIERLRRLAEPTGTVWSRINLAEVLPEPTPMTWAIVGRWMSGRGGLGLMYRDLGFDPDPALDDVGIYDLICGRTYCNLSREPRLQYRHWPFEHSFEQLKAEPVRALVPKALFNPARADWRFWLRLPGTLFHLARLSRQVRQLSRDFEPRFRREILPVYLAAIERAAAVDLGLRQPVELLHDLQHLIQLTLHDFARESLKPTVFASVAQEDLERSLTRKLGPQRAREAVGELMAGVTLDTEADLAGALRDWSAGRIGREEFLARFGHRGSNEMELAQPRWAEEPGALPRIAAADRQETITGRATWLDAWTRLVAEAKLPPRQQRQLQSQLNELRAHLRLRETAKHHLMKGYALIRRVLVAIDRCYGLEGGVFYLKPEELGNGLERSALLELVRQRQRRRALALSLEVPPILYSDDLEAIGRPVDTGSLETWQGVPVSAGVAEAEALVLQEAERGRVPENPYILVCPSTDPAWVPWFLQARGLVMACGGVLSHGAIVARELCLPAVAGLPDIHRRITTGQRLRVDGTTGRVTVLSRHP